MKNQVDEFYECHRCKSYFVSLHDLAIHQALGVPKKENNIKKGTYCDL